MILSHSVGAMRYMLKICNNFADEYDVKFNTNKSVAMRIGNRYTKMCETFCVVWQQSTVYMLTEISWYSFLVKQKN